MSDDTTVRDVFTDIDPDPDAVLEECSGASLDDLLEGEGDGAHDPSTDDELDVDDTMASDLFADLEAYDATTADADETPDRSSRVDESERAGDDSALEIEFESVGTSTETVREDAAAIDASAAELSAVASDRSQSLSRSQSPGTPDSASAIDAADSDADRSGGTSRTLTVRDADELELVGPDPTPTRVSNETFSTGALEGC